MFINLNFSQFIFLPLYPSVHYFYSVKTNTAIKVSEAISERGCPGNEFGKQKMKIRFDQSHSSPEVIPEYGARGNS